MVPSRNGRVPALILVAFAAGCSGTPEPDAFGNFEAEEVVVSAQTAGQIVRLDVLEGRTLEAEEVVGMVDTAQVALERDQIRAQRAALVAQHLEAERSLESLEVQHEFAVKSRDRMERLGVAGAATATQRDQAEREVRVLEVQASAARAGLERLGAEEEVLAARQAAAEDRLRRSTLRNPIPGTVLSIHAREGEMVQVGQPLYRIADLETLTLRAYVTGDQLGGVRLGNAVEVRVDGPDGGLMIHPGTVMWVSPRAEFTPTPVQTRDERASLVYAVKIRVENPEGILKIGMPGDVTLTTRTGAGAAQGPGEAP